MPEALISAGSRIFLLFPFEFDIITGTLAQTQFSLDSEIPEVVLRPECFVGPGEAGFL